MYEIVSVCSRDVAVSKLRMSNRKLNVISIQEATGRDEALMDALGQHAKNYIVLKFSDVEDDNLHMQQTHSELVWPEREDVVKALDFAQEHIQDGIIVHCTAGVSRSTAVAYAILCSLSLPPAMALEILYEDNPSMWPNDRLTRIASEYLRIPGMVVMLDEWKEEHRNDDITKYYGADIFEA